MGIYTKETVENPRRFRLTPDAGKEMVENPLRFRFTPDAGKDMVKNWVSDNWTYGNRNHKIKCEMHKPGRKIEKIIEVTECDRKLIYNDKKILNEKHVVNCNEMTGES